MVTGGRGVHNQLAPLIPRNHWQQAEWNLCGAEITCGRPGGKWQPECFVEVVFIRMADKRDLPFVLGHLNPATVGHGRFHTHQGQKRQTYKVSRLPFQRGP